MLRSLPGLMPPRKTLHPTPDVRLPALQANKLLDQLRELLGILDRASSLKHRQNTHSGSSPTDYEGCAPSTDAHLTSPQRPAPDDALAVPAPASAGLSQSCTRDRPRACLEASSHTTIQDSRTIFEHAVGVRTI